MGPICESHPAVDLVALLVYAGIGTWLLTQAEHEARSIVESRRGRGYAIANYDAEVRKWKRRYILVILVCMLFSLAGTPFCASKLL